MEPVRTYLETWACRHWQAETGGSADAPVYVTLNEGIDQAALGAAGVVPEVGELSWLDWFLAERTCKAPATLWLREHAGFSPSDHPDLFFDMPQPASRDAVQPDGCGPAIVGLIDDNIGFLNERFRRDGADRTRFEALWLQAGPSYEGGRLRRGSVIERAAIDGLIALGCERSVYARLSEKLFPPHLHRGLTFAASHGTHVADIAAGAEPGAMDEIDLLGVTLAPQSILNTSGQDLAPDVSLGLRWMVRRAAALSKACKAGPRPLVVNVSLGMTAGPKDGSSAVVRSFRDALDAYEMVTKAPARLVLAFGNDRRSRQVALLQPAAGAAAETLTWRVQPDDAMASLMEIRAAGPLDIALSPPSGGSEPVSPKPGSFVDVTHRDRAVARIYAEPAASGSGRTYVLAMHPTINERGGPRAPSGAWGLSVGRRTPASDPLVTLQIQRGDTPIGYRLHGRQSYFEHRADDAFDRETHRFGSPGVDPVTYSGTHSAFVASADRRILTVGAAVGEARRPGLAPAPARYSAEGSNDPAWTTRRGPDVTATADTSVNRSGVLASGTQSGPAVRFSGTSVAAPELVRRLALALGPGGALNGAGSDDEIATLLESEDAMPPGDEPAREGRGWLAPSGPRRA